MSDATRRITIFHHTSIGYAVFGSAELALGYVFTLWSIDSGSLLDYFLTIVLLIGGFRNLTLLVIRGLRRLA